MNNQYYYLHENGDLINKNPAVVNADPSYFDSPFVKKVWYLDLTDRADAWKLVLESLALGARKSRVQELANKWNLTLEDFLEMLAQISQPSKLMIKGKDIFLSEILNIDPLKFWNALHDIKELKLKDAKKIIPEKFS